jgi:hypothetical protein
MEMNGWFDNMGRFRRNGDDDNGDGDYGEFDHSAAPDLTPAIKPVLVIRGPETGCADQAIGFIGDTHIPVFRDYIGHPYGIAYVTASADFPAGVLLIGTKIDLVACAVTIAWNAEDREWLRGVKISPNFVPDALVKSWTEDGS